ncbi:MAG: cytochrome c [Pseudomonadales bacterium]|nr:cytochrome c [Pseudomonadales bacterium]
MIRRTLLTVAPVVLAVFAPVMSIAEEHSAESRIDLSPELALLLRAEMSELAGGLQSVTYSITTADWAAVEATSHRMHESYIMNASLTRLQTEELEQKLPERFKLLDAAFHARAEKLGQAAAAGDGELVTYHYSRLVENCVSCHSAYATNRFPGFARDPEAAHAH